VLSNGEVIWDIAGNVWEWTDDYIISTTTASHLEATRSEMPLPASESWIEYTAVENYKGLSYIRPQSHLWTSANGIGQIYTDSDCAYSSVEANDTCGVGDHNYHAFLRGGDWNDTLYAGVFALYLNGAPSHVDANFGFRCAR